MLFKAFMKMLKARSVLQLLCCKAVQYQELRLETSLATFEYETLKQVLCTFCISLRPET